MQVQARDLAGYTAKRVRAYENKSSSPKKHLGKLFEKTASAEPVETKQKNKKENRPKRKISLVLFLLTTPLESEIESLTLRRNVKEKHEGGLRGSSSIISPAIKAVTSVENKENVANKGRDTFDILQDVLQWTRVQPGAYIHENVELNRINDSLAGIFAKDTIAKGDTIAVIPFNITINEKTLTKTELNQFSDLPSNSDDLADVDCRVFQAIYVAITKDILKMNPYEEYLASLDHYLHPINWSEKAKSLLDKLDGNMFHLFSLQVDIENQAETCGFPENIRKSTAVNHAFMMALVRSEESPQVGLLPVMDLLNHDNAKTNVDNRSSKKLSHYRYYATSNIEEGQELIYSYTRCSYCGHNLPTSWLFDLYGFVESYPQRWKIKGRIFDVEREGASTHLTGLKSPLKTKDVEYFSKHVSRLQGFMIENKLELESLKAFERDTISSFHSYLLDAMNLALGTVSTE